MKNRLGKLYIVLSFALVFSMISCNNISQEIKTEDTKTENSIKDAYPSQDNKLAYISLGNVTVGKQAARSSVVTSTNTELLSKLTTVNLECARTGDDTPVNISGNNWSDFLSKFTSPGQTYPLQTGSYNFTLTATLQQLPSGSGVAFSASKTNINISSDTTEALSFTLAPTTQTTGGIQITWDITTNDNILEQVNFSLKKLSDGTTTPSSVDDFSSGKVVYQKDSLEPGEYELTADFRALEDDFDDPELPPLSTWKGNVRVAAGITTTATINWGLESVYTITWNTDGGTIVDATYVQPERYTRKSDTITLPTLTKTGYDFDGWYGTNDFSDTKITSIPKGSVNAKSLYARFIDTLYISSSGTSTADGTSISTAVDSIDSAVSKIVDYNQSGVNWKLVIDGEVTGSQVIANTITTDNAASITISGKTDSDTDSLNAIVSGTSQGTVLSVNSSIPVTIEKLTLTGGTAENGGGINIASGASIILKDDAVIKDNTATANGGGIYNLGTLTIEGGTIQNNTAATAGGAIYTTSDISMKGGIKIPFNNTENNNEICLASSKKIILTDTLSEAGTVATIMPDPAVETSTLVNGVSIIQSSELSDSVFKTQLAKFGLKQTRTIAFEINDSGEIWKNPWVKVSGKTFTGSETVTYNADDPAFPLINLKNSVVFIEGRTLDIPNLIVCDHEVTQAEYQRFCFFNNKNNPDYRAPGGYNDYGNGDNIPAYFVSWYDALVYCNLLSMAENLQPCYTIDGKTDPKEWPNVQTNGTGDETKYRGPSFYKSGDNDNPQKDDIWEAVTCDRSKNGYRLPTQAEWEYVARECNLQSEGQLIYSGTNDITELNYAGPTYAAVRTTKPNSLGIYDMSGNVAEWCWDLAGAGRVGNKANDITTTTPITGPASVASGNEEYRVLRGGATYEVAGTSSNYYNMAITKADKMRACAFDKQCGIRLFRTDTE